MLIVNNDIKQHNILGRTAPQISTLMLTFFVVIILTIHLVLYYIVLLYLESIEFNL